MKKIVFIVGHERSGTSLLRKVLMQHPDISIPPNDCNIFRYKNKQFLESSKASKIGQLRNDHKLKEWNIDWKLLNNKLDNTKCFKKFYRDFLLFYWDKSKTIWALKRPSYEHKYKILKKIFPNSIFISLLRDPRAVIASKKYYGGKLNFKQSRLLHLDLISLINSWRESYNQIKDISLNKSNLLLKYETICYKPEKTIKRICDRLKILFDKEMLLIGKYSNSSYNKISNNKPKGITPPHEKWRIHLTSLEKNIIEGILKHEMMQEEYKISSNKNFNRFSLVLNKFIFLLKNSLPPYIKLFSKNIILFN